MADFKSVKLANYFSFSQFWSWFYSVQVAPYFFPFIFCKKDLSANRYQKSAGDMLFFSFKIKFKDDTLFP